LSERFYYFNLTNKVVNLKNTMYKYNLFIIFRNKNDTFARQYNIHLQRSINYIINYSNFFTVDQDNLTRKYYIIIFITEKIIGMILLLKTSY